MKKDNSKKVRSEWKDLYGRDGESELVVLQKADTLLMKMQTEQISVSVWNLMPVTSAFMLTMVSLIFHYFPYCTVSHRSLRKRR